MPGGLGSAWTGLALAALILLDVTQMMPADRHTRGGDPPADPEVARRVLPLLRGAGDRWRIMDEFALSCRAGTRLHRRDLRGYQDPLMLASYEGVIDSLAEHPGLAPQFGVRYTLSSPHFIHGWDHHYLAGPDVLSARLRSRVLWQEGERRVIELADALPFAYFVPDEDVERVPDRHAVLARVKALAPAPIAVLEGGASGVRTEPARPLAAARGVQLERDTLSFAIEAPSRGVVVVNEAYYPGWRASVDGTRGGHRTRQRAGARRPRHAGPASDPDALLAPRSDGASRRAAALVPGGARLRLRTAPPPHLDRALQSRRPQRAVTRRMNAAAPRTGRDRRRAEEIR